MSDIKTPEFHHWLNTIVGVIDASFVLTFEELFSAEKLVGDLLRQLNIPGRGDPRRMPAALAAEVQSKFWAVQLHDTDRVSSTVRSPRNIVDGDCVVAPETWRNTLAGLIFDAYPDLYPVERMLTANVLDRLLNDLGAATRAPRFIPEDAIRHHLDGIAT